MVPAYLLDITALLPCLSVPPHPLLPPSRSPPLTPHHRQTHSLGSTSRELLTAPLHLTTFPFIAILVHEVPSAWNAITFLWLIYPLKTTPRTFAASVS